MVKGKVLEFSFVASKEDEGPLAALQLPKGSRLISIYREKEFMLPDADIELRKVDEVAIIARSKAAPQLKARCTRSG